MNKYADKASEKKDSTVVNSSSKLQSNGESLFSFIDNRPEGIAQQTLQEKTNNSLSSLRLISFQKMANDYSKKKQFKASPSSKPVAQRFLNLAAIQASGNKIFEDNTTIKTINAANAANYGITSEDEISVTTSLEEYDAKDKGPVQGNDIACNYGTFFSNVYGYNKWQMVNNFRNPNHSFHADAIIELQKNKAAQIRVSRGKAAGDPANINTIERANVCNQEAISKLNPFFVINGSEAFLAAFKTTPNGKMTERILPAGKKMKTAYWNDLPTDMTEKFVPRMEVELIRYSEAKPESDDDEAAPVKDNREFWEQLVVVDFGASPLLPELNPKKMYKANKDSWNEYFRSVLAKKPDLVDPPLGPHDEIKNATWTDYPEEAKSNTIIVELEPDTE